MVSDRDGSTISKILKLSKVKIFVKIKFEKIKTRDKVKVEYWMSTIDHECYPFIRTFE